MEKNNEFKTERQKFMEMVGETEVKIRSIPKERARDTVETAKNVLAAQLNSSIEYARKYGIKAAKSMLETVYTYVK